MTRLIGTPLGRSLQRSAPVARVFQFWLAAALLSGCGSPLETLNAVTPDAGYTRQAGVRYGEHPRQRLDVYRPDAARPGAVPVVFVYGGAWRDGDRGEYEFAAGTLADAGHVVILPDYRLYPDVTWPAFADDVVQAIARVQADAQALLGADLDRIVLMGHSSGAHTAAVLAADPARHFGAQAPALAGLIGLSGPYDLPLDNSEVAPVFEGASDATLKPPALVTTDHPPTLLLHGTDEERVLIKHTERYARALVDAGVPVEVERLEGVGHAGAIAEFAAPLDLLNDASETTLAWLRQLDRDAPAPDG